MSDIFISYAREDRDRVSRLADALQRQGWSTWWDPELRTGDRYREVLKQALDGARCVVVVWSHTSIVSSCVIDEAEEGMARNVLVPVLFDQVRPPLGFRQLQTKDLHRWDGSGNVASILDPLLHDLRKILGQKAVSESASDAIMAASEERSSEVGAIGPWLRQSGTDSAETNWESHSVIHRITRRQAVLAIMNPAGPANTLAPFILPAAQVVADLDHPGLAAVLDWGYFAERPYFVLASAAATLQGLVETSGPFDEIRALQIGVAVASAIAHLHARGIVHQLVNPSSILLDGRDSEPRVGWPVFCVRAGTPAGHESGASPRAVVMQYAAPEAAFGTVRRGETIDPPVDVYGLGEVLYFALTGQSAFVGATPFELMLAKSNAPRDMRSIVATISRPTALLVESLLAPDPLQRPAPVDQVGERCARILRRLGA